MKKLCFILFLLMVPCLVSALDVELYSKNAIVYDTVSKKVVFEIGDANSEVKIASLTKIMTSIVALENIKNLDEIVEINASMLSGIPWDASIAGLKIGDKVTYRDLVYASLLPSGADATNSLAYLISGSVSSFVELMNKKANELGLNHTHFVNTTGYDKEGHYSTPNEVLKFLLYALENPIFREIYNTREYTLANGKMVKSTLLMYNKIYNFNIEEILGSKTGYTNGAGTCMSALVNSNGREYVVLTLGAPVEFKKGYNLEDVMSIVQALDKEYENRVLYKKGDELFTIPVRNSKETEYKVLVPEDVTYYLKASDEGKVAYKYDGKKRLSFKDKLGEIGVVSYYFNDQLVGEQSIVLDKEFSVSYLKYLGPKIALVVLVIILAILSKKKIKKLVRHS